MSVVLSTKDGVKERKQYRCDLCGELINPGDFHDTRKGVSDGGMFTMRMHAECHAFERDGNAVDWEWYEDICDPAFDRADALAFVEKGNAK